MKDLNEYMPLALRKNWQIVCPISGKPLESAGPIFACGVHDSVDTRKLTEAKLEALYRKKHPMIRKKEEVSPKADISAKVDNSKKSPDGK